MGLRLILVRPLPDAVGETRRATHLIDLADDTAELPEQLAARCGARFAAGQLELLDGIRGMPCELCLAARPPNDPTPW